MPRFTFENKFTLGNAISVATFLVAAALAWGNLTSRVDAKVDKSEMTPIETRLAVVERNQVTGREAREEGQRRTEAAVEELRKQNVQILQTQAAILARLDALATENSR